MNLNPPDPHQLRQAALELAGQGLTPHDVDQALRLPPGMAAGLLASDDSTRVPAVVEKTAA